MDVSTIIKQSRVQTNTSVSQADDETMLEWLNIVQNKIFSKLATVDKKYTWDIYTDNTVAYQNEYTIPREIMSWPNIHERMKRLLKVFVIYKNVPVRVRLYEELPFPVANYKDYNNPVWLLADGSVFIYPSPYADRVDSIRFEGTYMPYPLKFTDTEDDIKLAPEYHDLYLYWLNQYAFAAKQLFDKEWLMQEKYHLRLDQLLREWMRDIQDHYTEILPDLSYFE